MSIFKRVSKSERSESFCSSTPCKDVHNDNANADNNILSFIKNDSNYDGLELPVNFVRVSVGVSPYASR